MTADPQSPGAPGASEPNTVRAGTRLALLGLALVVTALFLPALLGRSAFYERDILSYWVPQVASFVSIVAEQGAPPLWNPWFGFGQPLLEDPSYAVLYPPTWLNLVLAPHVYYSLFVVTHTFAAAAGMRLLARRLGFPPAPAFVAGVAFCASGPLLSAVNLHHHFASFVWTPWVLLGLVKILSRSAPRDGLALGLVAGLQTLAGSADVCLMTAGLGLAYMAALASRAGSRAALRRALPGLALAGIVAVGMAAAQFLPTLGLVRVTPRASQLQATSMYWSVHPLSLLDLGVDRLVAAFPLSRELRSVLFESRAPFFASVYLGLAALLLVPLGLLAAGPRRSALWLLGAFAACLLAALGRHSPLLPLLLKVPLLSVFRFPAKLMLAAVVPWALLVGMGFWAWQREWGKLDRKRILVWTCLVGAVSLSAALSALWVDNAPASLRSVAGAPGATLPGGELADTGARLRFASGTSLLMALLLAVRRRRPKPPLPLTAALLLLVVGDLLIAGRTVNDLAPPQLVRYRPPALDHLGPALGDARVYSVVKNPNAEPARGPADGQPRWAATLGAVETLRPPSGARWRIGGSFDGDFTGLAPPPQTELSWMLLRLRGTPLATRLLRMGSVGYVVTVGDAPFPGLEPVADVPSGVTSGVRWFRVPAPLPRSYWVGAARVASTPAEAYAVLADPAFAPEREVILAGGSPRLAAAPSARGRSRILARRADRVRLEVSASAPGYVVLLETYNSGWKATVDDQPVEVLNANVVFQAVALTAGVHVVEISYRPPLVVPALTVSAFTVVLAGLALALRKRAPAAPAVASGVCRK
jgi:hypothetical protein